jgi:hypothetical protein
MPQLTLIVDDTTEQAIREHASKQGLSVSHLLKVWAQRALVLEDAGENAASVLKEPQFLMLFKKLLTMQTESLSLMHYLVQNCGDEHFKKTNEAMLQKARAHAENCVTELLGE